MKRIVFVALLCGSSVSAFAQNTSTTQMALVQSSQFTNRLQYLMVQQAQIVLIEGQTSTGNGDTSLNYAASCHTLRYTYAQQVMISPPAAASAASVLVSGTNIAGGVIVGTVTGSGNTADSTASDAALAIAIAHDWNTLARCVANP